MSRRKQSKPQHFWSGELGEGTPNCQQLTDGSQAGCLTSLDPGDPGTSPSHASQQQEGKLGSIDSPPHGKDTTDHEDCSNSSGVSDSATNSCEESINGSAIAGVSSPAAQPTPAEHSSDLNSSVNSSSHSTVVLLEAGLKSGREPRSCNAGTCLPAVASVSTSPTSHFCDVSNSGKDHLLSTQPDLQSFHGSQASDVKNTYKLETTLVDAELCNRVKHKPAESSWTDQSDRHDDINSCDWASQSKALQELSLSIQEQTLKSLKHSPATNHNTSTVLNPADNNTQSHPLSSDTSKGGLNEQSSQKGQLSVTIPCESQFGGAAGSSDTVQEHLLQIGPLTPSSRISPIYLSSFPLNHSNSVAAAAAAALGIPWLSPLGSFSGLSPEDKGDIWKRSDYPCKVCGLILKSLPELGLHAQEHTQTPVTSTGSLTTGTLTTTASFSNIKVEPTAKVLTSNMSEEYELSQSLNNNDPHEKTSELDTSLINVEESDSDQPQDTPERHGGRAGQPSGQHLFNFHSPWEHFARRDSGYSGVDKTNIGQGNEQASRYLSDSQEAEALRALKDGIGREVEGKTVSARQEGDGLNSSGDTVKSDSGQGTKARNSKWGTTSAGSSNSEQTRSSKGKGSDKHISTEPSRSRQADGMGVYSDLLSKHLPGAYPAALAGFPHMFNLPLSSQWGAISKYSHVNGYMQGLIANPSMMLPGYSSHGMGTGSASTSRGTYTAAAATSGKHTESGLACSYCGKVCPRPSILKRHMMMHTGERPFECKACGQRFRAKGSMLFHQKLRHNMDVKLNKALEERYLQIVTNQRNKQMREERKKAALVGACSPVAAGPTSASGIGYATPEAHPWLSLGNSKHPATDQSFFTSTPAVDKDRLDDRLHGRLSLKDSGFVDASHSSLELSSLSHRKGKSPRSSEKSEGKSVDVGSSRQVPLFNLQENFRSGSLESPQFRLGSSVTIKEEKGEESSHTGANNNNNLEIEETHRERGDKDGREEAEDRGVHVQGRENMFTPEPVQDVTYDDNSNLKDNLDRMIMNAFSKLGLAPDLVMGTTSKADLEEGKVFQTRAKKLENNEVGEEMAKLHDDHSLVGQEIEYPSSFPGIKSSMVVQSESVLVTRLEGVNTDSGTPVDLYKCHLCQNDGLIFTRFDTAQEHLSKHMTRRMAFYECTFCPGRTYKFKTQLIQHLHRSHGLSYSTRCKLAGTKTSQTSKNLMQQKLKKIKMKYSGRQSSQLYQSPYYGNKLKTRTSSFQRVTLQPYCCQACQRSFKSYFASRRHAVFCRGRAYAREKKFSPLRTSTRKTPMQIKKRSKQSKNINVRSLMKRPESLLPSEARGYLRRRRSESCDALGNYSRSNSSFSKRLQQRPSVADSLASLDSEKTHESHTEVAPENTESLQIAKEIRAKERLDEDVTVVIPSDTPIDFMHVPENQKNSISSSNSEGASWSDAEESRDEAHTPSSSAEIGFAPVRKLMTSQQQVRIRRKSSRGVTPPTPGDSSMANLPPADMFQDRDSTDKHEARHYPRSLSVTQEDSKSSLDTDVSNEMKQRSLLYLSYLNQEGLAQGLPSSSQFSTASTPQSATPASLPNLFLPTSMSAFCPPLAAGLPSLMPASLVSPAQQAALLAQTGMVSPTMLGGTFSPFMNPFATLASHTQSPSLPLLSASATTPTAATPATATSAQKSVPPGTTDARSLAHRYPTKHQEIEAPQPDSDGDTVNGGSNKGSSLSRSHSRVYPVKHPVRREEACKPTVLSDGRTVYRCLYCNKDFATYSDVNRHMDFHEGRQDIRPYKCKFCDYYARTNSQLKVHMMRHQGIREFHCKLCNYKGVTQSDLNRHMKSQIHTMKAQNACNLCGEGFVSPKNLERHIDENHPHHSQHPHPVTSHSPVPIPGATAGLYGVNNHRGSTASSLGGTPVASPLPHTAGFNFQLPLPP